MYALRITANKGLQPLFNGCKGTTFIWIEQINLQKCDYVMMIFLAALLLCSKRSRTMILGRFFMLKMFGGFGKMCYFCAPHSSF